MHNHSSTQHQSSTTGKPHNHSRHIWHTVGMMLLLMAGAFAASSYMPEASWLYFIPLLLLCPLMMISMMYFMQPSQDHDESNSCHEHNISDKISNNN